MIVTVEHWCSPEFHSPLDLYYLSSKDAQEITRQVLSIKRAEPDPAQFQIPAGYTFVHSEEKPPVAANAS